LHNVPGSFAAKMFVLDTDVMVELMDLFGLSERPHREQIDFCITRLIGPRGRSEIELTPAQLRTAREIVTRAGFFDASTASTNYNVVIGGSYGTMLDGLRALGDRNADCFFGQRLRDDVKDGTIGQILERISGTSWARRYNWYYDQLELPLEQRLRTEHELGILAALEAAGDGTYDITQQDLDGQFVTYLNHRQTKHTLVVHDVPNAPDRDHPTTTSTITAWCEKILFRDGETVGVAAGAIEGIRHCIKAKGLIHQLHPNVTVKLLMRETPEDQRDYHTLTALHEVGKLVKLAFGIEE